MAERVRVREIDLTAYDLTADKVYGHVKKKKGRTEFLAFCRYLRQLYPPEVRVAVGVRAFAG
ncbi:MAG: hypothetical protein RIE08_08785 [Acidimicrobiales bacterium]